MYMVKIYPSILDRKTDDEHSSFNFSYFFFFFFLRKKYRNFTRNLMRT